MTAWSPGAEALSPFDEEGELKEDIPQELASFLQQFDVQKVFKVNVKKWGNENYAGRPTNPLPTFEGVIPTNEAVVGACGPAYYGFEVQWTPKDGKPRSEIYKIALIGAYWDKVHKEYKEKARKDELDEEKQKVEIESLRKNAGLAAAPVDPVKAGKDYMKDMLENMRMMNDLNGGGAVGGGGGGNVMAVMGQMMMGMMQMQMAQNQQNMQLLITVLGAKNGNDDPMKMVGLFEKMLTIKDGLMPRDKHWIESVVEGIAGNIEPLMAMFARANPEEDPMYNKMDRGMSEVREKTRDNPNLLKELVKHMDAKVGSKMTDKILKGFVDIRRNSASAAGAGAATSPEAGNGQEEAPAGAEEGENA